MSLLDFIMVALLTLGVLTAGMAFAKQGKNMTSFFAAGGAVPWQTSGLSLFMSFFSAGTFVVWGSVAYLQGWVAVSIQWTMAVAGLVVGTWIAPRWHRTGSLTVAEYIDKRLGVHVQKTYTFLFLFISLFLTASFLYPVAKIVEVSTGLNLNLCIILLGAFCILYVSVGGLWAVVSTDVLQFIILMVAIIIVVPMSLERVDGVQSFVAHLPERFFRLTTDDYPLPFILAFGLYNAIFLGGNWAYVQRFTCVRTATDARRVGWFFAALYFLSPVLWMLPPMVYQLLNPSLGAMESEGAYLMMCKEVLPKGILGLMIGGMIFATTSAMNSKLNIASGVVTNDLYRRLYPHSPQRRLILVARLSTVAFGVVSMLIALLIQHMGGVVNVVISLAALTGVPLYLPVIWTLFSHRQTGATVLATTIVSLAVNALLKFVAPALTGFAFSRTGEMVFGCALPILMLASFEFYFKLAGKSSRRYAAYTAWEEANNARRGSLAARTSPEVESENAYSKRIIGLGIFFIGLSVAALGLLSADHGSLVAGTGGCFMLIGAALSWTARTTMKKQNHHDRETI